MGAYMLVYLNAASIVAVLFLLLAFTVLQGASGVLEGFEVGAGVGPDLFGVALPVSFPFVFNGVGLLNDFNGVLPAIVGTFWLVVGAVLFAVPLGVGAAIFLTEYAERGWFTQVVEVATNGLWSTPSIVFGLFGFAFLIPRFGNGKSLLSGMLTLGFMLLPLVIAVAIASPIAGRVLDRVGSRAIVLFGTAMFVIGFGSIAGWTASRVVFYGGSVAIGIGLACLLGSALSYILLRESEAAERTVAQGVVALFLGVGQLILAQLLYRGMCLAALLVLFHHERVERHPSLLCNVAFHSYRSRPQSQNCSLTTARRTPSGISTSSPVPASQCVMRTMPMATPVPSLFLYLKRSATVLPGE